MKKEKLHIIAPILSEISLKKNAFKVPDNYFNTIEDDVVATINLQNLLSKNSTSNFKAPNNYFDTIEEITITKLKAEVIQTKEKSQLPDGYFDTFEDLVLTKIKKRLEDRMPSENLSISRERHSKCLLNTVLHLRESQGDKNIDLFAEDIRQAVKSLSSLFGSSEE